MFLFVVYICAKGCKGNNSALKLSLGGISSNILLIYIKYFINTIVSTG